MNGNSDDIDYIGNFVYTNRALSYILTTEGKIVYNAGTYAYQYFLKDHLGNVRAVIDQNQSLVQATDYYPFGMQISLKGDGTQKYLYNGKEIQEDVDWYDYGARITTRRLEGGML